MCGRFFRRSPRDEIAAAFRAVPSAHLDIEAMIMWSVDPRMDRPTIDDPAVLDPVEPPSQRP